MRKIILAGAMLAIAGLAAAGDVEPPRLSGELQQVRTKARAGDYNAQRNLAYAYATGEAGGVKYPVAACGWYMSIPYLHETRVHAGDMGNIWTYCSKLNMQQHEAAVRHSMQIVGSLRK